MSDSLLDDGSEMPLKQLYEGKEGIKLTRNSKGYGWEIKILALDKLTEEDIKRLQSINNSLLSEYGGNT